MDSDGTQSTSHLDQGRDPQLVPWLAAAVIALIVGVVGGILAWTASAAPGNGAGWGDLAAGTLGTAASIASTVLFFGALVMQRQELRNQRVELAAQREEMRQTRGVHEQQMEVTRNQSRESAAAARFGQALDLLGLHLEMGAMSKQWEGNNPALHQFYSASALRTAAALGRVLQDSDLEHFDKVIIARVAGLDDPPAPPPIPAA